MSIQQQPPVRPVSLVKSEHPTVVKNEPEIGIDEEILADIKDIDILTHTLCEDSIKSETVPKDIVERSEAVETQVIVKTENAPVKIANVTPGENLYNSDDTGDRNLHEVTGPGVVEIQGSNEDFNDISVRSGKPKRPKKTDFAKSHRTSKTTSLKNDKEKVKVIEAAVIPVKPHEYTSLAEDKHVCKHCQRVFTKLRHVRFHITKMHREVTTMYRCPYCSFKSKWKISVRFHIIQRHKKTKDIQWFQCHLCDMKFKLKCLLARHTLIHYEQRFELCPVCGKGFSTRSKAIRHVRLVHNKESLKRLKCQECEYTSLTEQRLKSHIKAKHMKTKYKSLHESDKEKHEKRYRCDKCNYKTHAHQTLKMHKKNHLKPEEIQYFHCYHCAYKSNRRINLISHISRHFRNGDVPFHCYLCDFMTLRRSLIIEHIKKHKQFKPSQKTKTEIDDRDLKYHCSMCDYKTFLRQNLNNHKIVHLKPEEIKYFYCYHCSFKGKRKDNLKNHIFRHFKNEDVSFHCYICDFTTLKRNLIIEHMMKHKKFKPHELSHETETKMNNRDLKYRCDKCHYKTSIRHCLKNHKLIHLKPEEIQYFYCYHCSYKSKRRNDLNAHISKHFRNEDVPFHCYICNFVTLKRHLISEHIKKHGKFKPSELSHETEMNDGHLKYRCDKCHYKTHKPESLKKHKLIHLKPEEIQYFYCYHCSFKAKRRDNLRAHICRHFKKGDVPFHCYVCDFITLKRNLISEHIKTHSKVQIKTEIKEEN